MRIDKRTYADRREYNKAAVIKRRRLVKEKAVAFLGGCCIICGYNKHPGVMDFHHVDPSTKSFGIGSYGHSRSWERVKNELEKCVLVCANCHREIELGITLIPKKHLQIRIKSLE